MTVRSRSDLDQNRLARPQYDEERVVAINEYIQRNL